MVEIEKEQQRGETGAAVGKQVGGEAGGAAGETIGAAYGGPIGAAIGKYVGEKVGESVGEYVGDEVEDELMDDEGEEEEEEEEGGEEGEGEGEGEGEEGEESEKNEKKKKGSCSDGTNGVEDYSTACGGCHKTPATPKFKLQISENNLPQNWWDKLPDFDPRIFDSITYEQAAACVKFVFDQLPDVHELENQMEARKFPKICPRLKVNVPRTKLVKPKEIIYDTKIDDFIKKDQTY